MQVERGQQSYKRIGGKPVFAREQCSPIDYDEEEEWAKDAHFGFDGY